MQINNFGKVSFGTRLDIKPDDLNKMQKVNTPYISRIMQDLKALKDDTHDHDVLEIRNVSVRDGRDETSFIADVRLYNKQLPEYEAAQKQISIDGMENGRGRINKVHRELKAKLDDILTLTANIISRDKD